MRTKLNKLSLKDKTIFCKYLSLSRHELSTYSFANIYIWKGLFDIRWTIIKDCLCVFFRDKIGCFLYLAPLAKKLKSFLIAEAFKIMDGCNKAPLISHIENIEGKDKAFFENLGYEVKEKPPEYLCLSEDLAGLSGNKFKSKRASYNYFVKHYKFNYAPFKAQQASGCLALYDDWMKERKTRSRDSLYRGMLEDSRISLRCLLKNYADLKVMGRVVSVDGRIRAFSFGFPINRDSFCVLYEITDLSVKGLAQFIFRQFSRDLNGYKYINIMDDSGLENLRKVKLSYRPVRLIPAYIVKRRGHP